MALFKIYTGKRGRPLSIDPELELERLIDYSIPKAKTRLAQIRRETRGSRDPDIVGTETDLPGFINTTIDALVDLTQGGTVDAQTLRELKRNIKITEQLGSKQRRVYGRALTPLLEQDYFKQLEKTEKSGSRLVKQANDQFRRRYSRMTRQEQQSFFFSQQYQDIRTQVARYEHIRAWAEDRYNQKDLTDAEAWALLREQRLADFGKDIGSFAAAKRRGRPRRK